MNAASTLPDAPTVAVIVPCLNEAPFIEGFVRRTLAMDYPADKLSLWIADGMSTDGTREILVDYAKREPRLHVLDNPRRTTACALNIALKASTSDVVVRLDVHAEYPHHYISHLVALLRSRGADNAGALRHTARGKTAWEHTCASMISAPFANGGAPWRSSPTCVQEVESVFCGCFPRSVFTKLGLFDERMIRIEDREFNSRIRAAGGKILLDPSLACIYFPRTQLGPYLRWTFSGPFRLFYSRRLTRTPLVRARNLGPLAFFVYHLALPIGANLVGPIALLPLIIYALLAGACSVVEAIRHKHPAVLLMLPPMLYVSHLLYGAGAAWGWLRSLLPLPPPRPEGKFSH